MNQYQVIYEKLKEADFVLLGIGKELGENRTIQGDNNTCSQLINDLYDIVKEKNYFIVTTNIDDCIYQTKFEKEKIVAPCGSNHRWQCKNACTNEVWMEQKEECPHCKGEVVENIWKNQPYVETGYLEQWKVYTNWLQHTLNKKIVVLELGENFQTPSVMRWPFEKITYINQKSYFVRVGEKFSQLTEEMAKDRAISMPINSRAFIENLKSIEK